MPAPSMTDSESQLLRASLKRDGLLPQASLNDCADFRYDEHHGEIFQPVSDALWKSVSRILPESDI